MHRARLHRFATHTMMSFVGLLLCLATATVLAQQTPAPVGAPSSEPSQRHTPTPDELEPAVDTTRGAGASDAAQGASAPPVSAPDSDGARTGGGKSRRARGTAAADSAGATAAAKAEAGAKTGARKGPDRLELDTTDITGNRELPKVLYIVPWKRSDLGDLTGKPVNSLIDEVLQPLDRDVFTRENRYYDALKPGQAGARAGAVQGSGDKP
jgi:hypothetical protein